MLLTDQEQAENELKVNCAPGPAILQSYWWSGLVISKDVDNSPLQFLETITTEDIDKKLRTLFPKVFTYLDEQHPNVRGQIRWALAANSGAMTMTLSGVGNPCREDITDTCHPKGKKWNTQSMYFGMFSAESVVIGYQLKLIPYLCSDMHGDSWGSVGTMGSGWKTRWLRGRH